VDGFFNSTNSTAKQVTIWFLALGILAACTIAFTKKGWSTMQSGKLGAGLAYMLVGAFSCLAALGLFLGKVLDLLKPLLGAL
jgi:hypothetical protein